MTLALDRPVASTRATDPDWWRGAVIYQIYPRSFQDSNGDGVGDLPGITRRLSYVADLGADAIWLSPFFTSPMKDFGYDVSNYCDVDPIFGSLADFEALTAEAHRLGLKVIIDQVISHSSDLHPWFHESRSSRTNPKADWYVWADAKPDGTVPSNWLSVFGGSSWEWDTRRCQYYLHNFLTTQPDLNFHCPEVQDAMLATMRFWLERGVDGFRLDTVNYYFHDLELRNNPPATHVGSADAPAVNPYAWQLHLYDKNRPENVAFLKRMRAMLDEFPGSTTVGEVGEAERSLEIMAEYTAGGDRLHMCYTFDLLGPAWSKAYLLEKLGGYEAAAGDGWPCWAFSNHDVPRYLSRFLTPGADPATVARTAIGILSSVRGSVCLYEGEELGLTEAELALADLVDPYGIRFWPEYKGRDGCRTPMPWAANEANAGFSTGRPWLPVPAEHVALAVDRQLADPKSVHAHYQRMLAFRRGEPALRLGSIEFLASPDNVLAYRREHGNEGVICVFNLGATPAKFELPASTAVTPVDLGYGSTLSGTTVTLPPNDAFFGRLA
jgi:alpha-glucosidase